MGLILTLWFLTASFVWTPAPGGVAPTAFVMYRQVQGQPWQRIATIPVPDTDYQDEATGRGQNCYRVTAVTATAESGPSNTICIKCQGKKCR